MLKNRIEYILLLTISLVTYIFFTNYVSLLILISLVVGVIVSSVITVFASKKVSINLMGDSFSYTTDANLNLNIRNDNKHFPVSAVAYVECENSFCKDVTSFKIKTKHNSKIEEFNVSRLNPGRIIVTVKRVYLYDSFGIFRKKITLPAAKTILVYPKATSANLLIDNAVSSTNGDGEKYSLYKKGQDLNEVFSLREYEPGDELRRIHWKLSASQDKLITREYSLSLNYPVTILIENSLNGQDVPTNYLSKQLQVAFQLMENLVIQGLGFAVMYKNFETGNMETLRVDGPDELAEVTANVLSISVDRKSEPAIKLYKETEMSNLDSALIYVSSVPNTDLITEVMQEQYVKTILITEDKLADDYSFDINI